MVISNRRLRVVFMCGPAGAGKSSVARELEAEGMVRLSFDDEAWRRGIRTMPLTTAMHDEIERHLQGRLLDHVRAGDDVVLDFSFWSRRMRADYRALLAPFGIEPDTIYLDTPRAVALARVEARRHAHGDDFRISPEIAAEYFDHFEPPTLDEGPLTILRGTSDDDATDTEPNRDGR